MRTRAFIFAQLICLCSYAQNNLNHYKNLAVKGYDVVAYFSNQTVKGSTTYQLKYKELIYRFSTEENKKLFDANPAKYVPQYGGWCAYAMGKDGSKVDINPETYEIRGGKLYLFYNKFGTNTLDLWHKENPETLKVKADKNWKEIYK